MLVVAFRAVIGGEVQGWGEVERVCCGGYNVYRISLAVGGWDSFQFRGLEVVDVV